MDSNFLLLNYEIGYLIKQRWRGLMVFIRRNFEPVIHLESDGGTANNMKGSCE